MDRSGASAYVYAKASGMLSKSFVGSRAQRLFEVKTLQELWSLVFECEVPMIPEVLLAKEIEKVAEKAFIDDFLTLLRMYSKPDDVLLSILHSLDYENLKEVCAALCLGEKELPQIKDIGEFSVIDYKAWPNIEQMTKNSPIAWLNSVPTLLEQKKIDARLDVQYVLDVWNSINQLPVNEREPIRKMLGEELSLKNVAWALRLRVYYNMSKEEIIPYLASVSETPDVRDVLAGEAIRVLDYAVDSFSDWERWKYSSFLNPHEEGVVWNIDPRWVQNAARLYTQKKALKQFHQHPFTAEVLVTWFKIKEYELDCIRTAAEGLRLSVPDFQMKEIAGLTD